MTRASHIPKPWTCTPCHTDVNAYRIWDEHGNYHVEPSKKERKAIALLIAAAPDLLNALQAAERHLEWCGYEDNYERECAREQKLEKRITAAIAKAKGE